MCDSVRHRGPDAEGMVINGSVALGMRRLAIIDLAGGRQPIFNEDRTVAAVFNGEIYNFREIRERLEALGHRFASGADGEVIPHLWEEHGEAFPEHLNGMFAIALHDARRRRLILVRDRIGIKPLYYTLGSRHVLFGSEIKALLAAGLVERRLDLDALGQFLAWEYVPAPRTLLKNVHKLEPGAMLDVDLERMAGTPRPWWDVPHLPPGQARKQDAAAWEEAIDAKVTECVRRQLVSDVPLGAFLSGGVDSSLVVASMGGARTFSIAFEDPSYNEAEWARRVAAHLGVSHHVEVIQPEALGLFQELMPFLDDPIGDFSVFPTYLVSRLARQEVTVALSGDGGDEVFGGYETYLAEERARSWERVPALIRGGIAEPLIRRLRPSAKKKGLVNMAKRFVEGLQHEAELEHARWRLFVGTKMRRRLFTPEAQAEMPTPVGGHIRDLFDRAGRRPALDRRLYVDLKSYLSDNCLAKVDRMSMACSLEARVPLLDHELVELAFEMPPCLKVDHRRTKVLLKNVAARHVPAACVHRPKQGFSIPIKNWLRRELRDVMEDLLAPGRLSAEGIFDVETVERIKVEHLENRANHSHVLWSLLVFEDWRRRWSA